MRRTVADLKTELSAEMAVDIGWSETEPSIELSPPKRSTALQREAIPVLSQKKTIMMLERHFLQLKGRSVEMSKLCLLVDSAARMLHPSGRICVPKQNIIISKDLQGETHFPGEGPPKDLEGCPFYNGWENQPFPNAQAIGICLKCVAGNRSSRAIVI